MPIYEYYCENCNGVFETLRPIRESSDPVPCPQCSRDAQRMMPTTFSAFTMRDGYPRSIPDTGTYYHLGKTVTKPITGGVAPNEHPEINKPEPAPAKTRAEKEAMAERTALVKREMNRIRQEEPPPEKAKSSD